MTMYPTNVTTLDELQLPDRVDLEIHEIRAAWDEMADALFGEPRFIDEFVDALIEERTAWRNYATSRTMSSALHHSNVMAGLGETVRDRVLVYLAERMEEKLASAYEDAQPGMTVEQEDNLCRARDLIAGCR